MHINFSFILLILILYRDKVLNIFPRKIHDLEETDIFITLDGNNNIYLHRNQKQHILQSVYTVYDNRMILYITLQNKSPKTSQDEKAILQ